MRRKRQHEVPEEGEIGPSKEGKQHKVTQDQRSNRSSSVESREDPLAAHVRCTPRIWSLKLELDGVPIAWDTSIKNYQGRQAGHITETLEQPFLLPRGMEAYRRFNQQVLFLSFKRDLAIVSNLTLIVSSLTHSLQIYCTGLIGPGSHTFWAWTPNRDPTH